MGNVLFVRSGVIVFSPDRAEEARAQAHIAQTPLVAFMPIAPGDRDVAEGAYGCVALRADAYASDDATLEAAISYVANEPRSGPSGPLRLTYLGSLGERRPPMSPPIGGSISLAAPILVGRMEDCTLCLRQGGHSDQNTVARRHARVEPTPPGARVIDFNSTNGTWVGGVSVMRADVSSGDEIAFACTHRFRVDGAP